MFALFIFHRMLQVRYSTGENGDMSSADIPLDLLESLEVWDQVLSHHTWSQLLTDSEREHLSTLLPDIPPEEQRENLEQLFDRKEFRFGTSPLTQAYYSLKQLTPHCHDWIELEVKQSAKLQHRMMTQHYGQIITSLAESRKRSYSQDELERKLHKTQNKLWKSNKAM